MDMSAEKTAEMREALLTDCHLGTLALEFHSL